MNKVKLNKKIFENSYSCNSYKCREHPIIENQNIRLKHVVSTK